jgi:hypothetical protein
MSFQFLESLPICLHWNVIKYLSHPTSDLIKQESQRLTKHEDCENEGFSDAYFFYRNNKDETEDDFYQAFDRREQHFCNFGYYPEDEEDYNNFGSGLYRQDSEPDSLPDSDSESDLDSD